MFNLVVKDPITTRTRRTLSEHDWYGARPHPSVLETFQTYREVRRAVNFVHSELTEMYSGAPDLASNLLSHERVRYAAPEC